MKNKKNMHFTEGIISFGIYFNLTRKILPKRAAKNINIKVGQNTEKSPGDLRKLAFTQTLEKEPSTNAGVKNSLSDNNNDNPKIMGIT